MTPLAIDTSGHRVGGLDLVGAFPPLDTVNALALDETRGVLWAATDGGVVRWSLDDGSHVAYSMADGLPANRMLAVALVPDGDVWAGTESGVAHDPGTGRWEPEAGETALATAEVRAVAVGDDGTVWLGTNAGLGRKGADGWRTYAREDGLPSHDIWALATDPSGGVWILMHEDYGVDPPAPGGVAHLSADGTWNAHRFAESYGYARGFASDGERALFVDPSTQSLQAIGTDGSVAEEPRDDGMVGSSGAQVLEVGPDGTWWFADTGGIVYVQAPGDSSWQPLDLLAPASVAESTGILPANAIALGASGGAWFGGQDGIMYRGPDEAWGTLLAMPDADGLKEAGVGRIVVDAEDGVWFATARGLRHLATDGKWTQYPVSGAFVAGSDLAVPWAVDDRGNGWIATDEGVRRLSPDGTMQDYGTSDGLPGLPVAIGADADGGVWFVTASGGAAGDNAPELSADLATAVAAGDLATQVAFQLQHEPVAPVLGAALGLTRLAPDGTWTTDPEQEGLTWNGVGGICPDAVGNTWFATQFATGLTVSTGTGVSVRAADGSWRTYTAREGLGSNDVRGMAADADGGMWFATDLGASFRAADGTWSTYLVEDGLGADDVRGVAVDAAGNVLFATFPRWGGDEPKVRVGGGLTVRSPDAAWRTYTTADGLPSNRLLTVAVDHTGRIWLGTEDAGAVAMRLR